MNKTIIIFAIVLIIAIAGIFLFLNSNQGSTPRSAPQSQGNTSQTSKKTEGYQGSVLAGSVSPLIEFNSADYEKAKSEGKVIVLYFYASWCPICRVEQHEILSGFDSLANENVIGFRVNFNDSDTDTSEQALASEFNVSYQHTKVFLKSGVEVSRFLEQWTKEDFLQAVNKALE